MVFQHFAKALPLQAYQHQYMTALLLGGCCFCDGLDTPCLVLRAAWCVALAVAHV